MSSSAQTSVPASVALFPETRQHPQPDIVAHRELHRPRLEHLGPERGQLQHLLERDPVELARLGGDPRVGGIDPVHIRVDVAALGAKRRGERHRRGVRAAAPERGDAALGADPLKPGDHGHAHAFAEFRGDVGGGDLLDPGGGMRRIGPQRHLPALPAARGDIHFLQGQRHQPGGDGLAGADHGIVFARIVERRDLAHPADELVGLARHGRDDDDHVMAARDLDADPLGRAADPVGIGDRGAAEFHHENGHGARVLSPGNARGLCKGRCRFKPRCDDRGKGRHQRQRDKKNRN